MQYEISSFKIVADAVVLRKIDQLENPVWKRKFSL